MMKEYEKYKQEAFAKRKLLVLSILDQNITEGLKQLDTVKSDIDEARATDPTIPSVDQITSGLKADRVALESQLDHALQSEDETAFQKALTDFRSKWEAVRTDMEKSVAQSVAKICTVVNEQFKPGTEKINSGLTQIRNIEARCTGSVTEECLKVQEFSPRFGTLTRKLTDLQTEMGLVTSMCQNPEAADRATVVALLKKVQVDGEDVRIYGEALEAEKKTVIAATTKQICDKYLPTLQAAERELTREDSTVISNHLARCKGHVTEECKIINQLTPKYNTLKSKLATLTSNIGKIRGMCASELDEMSLLQMKDLALVAQSDGEDLKALAGELKEEQSKQVTAKALCRAVEPSLDQARKEIGAGLSEATKTLNDCKGKTDARCSAILGQSVAFADISSRSQATLGVIDGLGKECGSALETLPSEAFLSKLTSLRTEADAIKNLISKLKGQEDTALANYIASGKTFKVVFDVAPSVFDDSAWLEAKDPMGTLKGGETYTVTYNASSGWRVTGFNEASGRAGTWTYRFGEPKNFQLDLWGRVYSFDSAGSVFDPDFGLVGHIIK
ncbi:MAG: hypothetical protein V1821_00375 [bacterium]